MHPDFVKATEMLPMPRLRDLSEAQVQGKQCVWCAGLSTFDLGSRLSTLNGGLHPWRPRGCAACTRSEARRVFRNHIRSCARCNPTRYCVDAQALYALGFPGAKPERKST